MWWSRSKRTKEPKADGISSAVSANLVILPDPILEETRRLLLSFRDSESQHEGIAYWAGIVQVHTTVVTSVIVPEAETTYGSYETSVTANARVIRTASSRHLQILAQVHGHPGDWVGHSRGDDLGAFMPYGGFYSIVVPYYGRQGLLPLTQCGVHEYRHGRFERLLENEICRRFIVTPVSVDLRRGALP